MTILKLIGTILAGWFVSVGALITFVQLVSWMGYTHDAVVTWRPAPVEMFYADAYIPTVGILLVVISLIGIYVLELLKQLKKQ